MTNEEFFNLLLSEEYDEDTRYKEVINVSKSKSTNSTYIIFENTNGSIATLAISDHRADKHDDCFEDCSFIDDVDIKEFRKIVETFNDDYDKRTMLPEMLNYGISFGKKYDANDGEYLTGRQSAERAMVDEHYDIKYAEVIKDRQLLKVTYNDNDIEYYTDFIPSQTIDGFNADQINYFSHQLFLEQLKKALYTQRADIIIKKDVDIDFSNLDEDEEGKDFTLERKAMELFSDPIIYSGFEAVEDGNKGFVYVEYVGD